LASILAILTIIAGSIVLDAAPGDAAPNPNGDWNIALAISAPGDGDPGTTATFVTGDGVGMNNCGSCDFAFDATIDGASAASIPWVINGLGGYLPLFDAPGSLSFAEGSYGQWFTAATTGTLDSAALQLSCLVPTTNPDDVNVSLYALDSTGQSIDSGIVSVPFPWDDCVTATEWSTDLPTFSSVTFDFDAPVVAGGKYAVLFTGDGIGGYQPPVVGAPPTTTTPTTTTPTTSTAAPTTTTAPTTSTTAPTAPVTSVAPMPDADGRLPEMWPGAGQVTAADGSVQPIEVRRTGPSSVAAGDDDIGMELLGDPATTEVDGKVMTVRPGGGVRVTGFGFAPGSEVEVWMFSEPRLLATVQVGAAGTFDALVEVPAGLPVGHHTVQAEGVGVDGAPRALSIGVVVADGASAASSQPSSLAFTGGHAASLAVVAVAMLCLGLLLVVNERRRRSGAVDC
jgi:hypothetical protein